MAVGMERRAESARRPSTEDVGGKGSKLQWLGTGGQGDGEREPPVGEERGWFGERR